MHCGERRVASEEESFNLKNEAGTKITGRKSNIIRRFLASKTVALWRSPSVRWSGFVFPLMSVYKVENDTFIKGNVKHGCL